jgi:cytoskeleton protein RodZ
MDSIGDRFRQERLRRGLDLSQISELTKINPAMLEAIEADDLEKLPGSFFARSFVRQYARALDLDENEFEAELQRVAGFEEPVAPEPETSEPVVKVTPVALPSAARRPGGHSLAALAAFIVIVAACSAVYTLVQRMHETTKPAVVSARPAPTPHAPVVAPSPAAPAPLAEPTAGAPDQDASPTPTPAGAEAATATPEPAPAANPLRSSVPEGETAAIRLELHTTAEAWVRVIGDGKNLYSGVLQPNEARVFEGKDWMTLRTGNAAALAVTYNGQPVGELGPPNQVRTVQFTPSGFTLVTAAAPKPQTPADEP